MPYKRNVSTVDRFFSLSMHRPHQPPVQAVNQFVLEGTGNLILTEWQQAVEKVVAAIPALSLVQSGHGAFTTWIEGGVKPQVVLMENVDWDGSSSENAPFIERQLDIRHGPSSEIILIPGKVCQGKQISPSRVVFRTHHALMDGMSTSIFIKEVFKALRGEAIAANEQYLHILDLIKDLRIDRSLLPPLKTNCLSLDGTADDVELDWCWRRQTIPGEFKHSSVMVIYELAKIIRANHPEGGDVVIRMPMDLRRHSDKKLAIGNLIRTVPIAVEENATESDVRKSLLMAAKNKLDLNFAPPFLHTVYNSLPICLLSFGTRFGAKKILYTSKKSKFHALSKESLSGILSSLGSLDPTYNYPHFTTDTAFVIPVSWPSGNFMVTFWENPEAIEVGLGMPIAMASRGRIEKCMGQIATALGRRENLPQQSRIPNGYTVS